MEYEKICMASLNAYHRMRPDAFFRRPLKMSEIEEACKSAVFVAFCELVTFIKSTEGYFATLKIIEKNTEDIYRMIMLGEKGEIITKIENLIKVSKKEEIEEFDKYFKEEQKKL